jgi:hypothetical protein
MKKSEKSSLFSVFLVQQTFWWGAIEVRALGEPYLLLQDRVHFPNYDGLPIGCLLNGNELKRIQMNPNEGFEDHVEPARILISPQELNRNRIAEQGLVGDR